MGHDVFISYAHEDKSIADAICAKLEENKIRCWIAPRDISPGEKYAPALVHAIEASKLVVVVFSHNADKSPHVMTEIERAFNLEKIIIPFRIEDILPSDEFQYFIGRRHWLDALTPPLEDHITQLVQIAQKILGKTQESEVKTEMPLSREEKQSVQPSPVPGPSQHHHGSTSPPSSRKWIYAGAIVAVVVIILLLVVSILYSSSFAHTAITTSENSGSTSAGSTSVSTAAGTITYTATDTEPVSNSGTVIDDEFTSSTLGGNWKFVDPSGGSSYSLTANPGGLQITTSEPPTRDLYTNIVSAPRMMQSVKGDFTVETKVSGTFDENDEGAGLLIWIDSDNFIRLERMSRTVNHPVEQQILFAVNRNDNFNTPSGGIIHLSSRLDPTYLKIQKSGNLFSGYYSSDGSIWKYLGDVSLPNDDQVSVGLDLIMVYHTGTLIANFDYFKLY
jgi:regulation of enolase protein 1 (concanavalin A-like superfamily)